MIFNLPFKAALVRLFSQRTRLFCGPSQFAVPQCNFIEEWQSDWNCYWEDGELNTSGKNFVFKPSLQLDERGFISIDRQDFSRDGFEVYLQILLKLRTSFEDDGYECDGQLGSESGYPFLPIIFQCSLKDTPVLSPASILKSLGANPQLFNAITEFDVVDLFDEFTADVNNVFASPSTLSLSPVRPVAFYCGSELLNPVPVLVVGRLSPDLVGGIMTAIVHT